jgi:Protein of unknown function (DUF3568)
MKKMIFAVLVVGAIAVTGCVHTVSDTSTFATTFGKDTFSNKYARTVDQVYQASYYVINHDGVVVTEYIPHDNTNAVRSLMGRVNNCKVWVRCESVTPQISQVSVEARTKWGTTDLDLTHELATEISLQLVRQGTP